MCYIKEQEKAEKVSKRESTLQDVESNTKQLRELLEQHAITGTSLQPSDDMKVCYYMKYTLRLGSPVTVVTVVSLFALQLQNCFLSSSFFVQRWVCLSTTFDCKD